MNTLIDRLRSLNRKERFHLLHYVQGLDRESFSLGVELRNKLASKVKIPRCKQIPQHAYVAMDYHLDWIEAALRLVKFCSSAEKRTVPRGDITNKNQMDIDLLVAFEHERKTHIVLIEAKGYSDWDNKQLCKKSKRLAHIIYKDGTKWSDVRPHFLLVSPKEPQKVCTKSWPDWMTHNGKPRSIHLPLPKNVERVVRCDKDGRANRDGEFVVSVDAIEFKNVKKGRQLIPPTYS